LLVPGSDHEAYFSRGTRYVKIHLKDNKITGRPGNIAGDWPGLTQAGFDCVDAFFVPEAAGAGVWVFRGNKVAKIRVVEGQPDQLIINPTLIKTAFPTLYSFVK
jgi:hypothetical protein